MQTATPEPLLDINQVAERFGTSVRHVRRLVFEKRISYFKVGGYVRFEAADVEAWIAKSRVSATEATQPVAAAELRRRLAS